MKSLGRNDYGSAATEFVLVLPFAIILIASVVAVSLTGVRALVGQLAVVEAARTVQLFEEGLVQSQYLAALWPGLFGGGWVELKSRDGGSRTTNEDEAVLHAVAISNAAMSNLPGGVRAIFSSAPVTPALPAGIGDKVLQESDTPAPFCRRDGGYAVCGYPQ